MSLGGSLRTRLGSQLILSPDLPKKLSFILKKSIIPSAATPGNNYPKIIVLVYLRNNYDNIFASLPSAQVTTFAISCLCLNHWKHKLDFRMIGYVKHNFTLSKIYLKPAPLWKSARAGQVLLKSFSFTNFKCAKWLLTGKIHYFYNNWSSDSTRDGMNVTGGWYSHPFMSGPSALQ